MNVLRLRILKPSLSAAIAPKRLSSYCWVQSKRSYAANKSTSGAPQSARYQVNENKQFRIERKNGVEFINGGTHVAVVALEQNGTIPLLKRHRPVVDDFLFEIPCAPYDAQNHASPKEFANTVLRAQTGLSASTVSPLCQFYVEPGSSNLLVLVYVAQSLVVEEHDILKLYEPEDPVTLHYVPLRKVREHIEEAHFRDAKTFAALSQFLILQSFQTQEEVLQAKKIRFFTMGAIVGTVLTFVPVLFFGKQDVSRNEQQQP